MTTTTRAIGTTGAQRQANTTPPYQRTSIIQQQHDFVGGLAAAVRYCVEEEAAAEAQAAQLKAKTLTRDQVFKLRQLAATAAAAASSHDDPQAAYLGAGPHDPSVSVAATTTHKTPTDTRRKSDADTSATPTKGQRFLRPSELFANDHRARVRAEHPSFLDRAVRTKLSEMWRDVDSVTRAAYVERARLEREKARARQQQQQQQLSSPPPSTDTVSTSTFARGDAVCLVNDTTKKGFVTGKTSAWVLVNFFGDFEAPRERPWRLKHIPHAKSGTSPFELVSQAQISLDARVASNRYCDQHGDWRRQLVAVLYDTDEDVAAVCDACAQHDAFRGGATFTLPQVETHLHDGAHLAATSHLFAFAHLAACNNPPKQTLKCSTGSSISPGSNTHTSPIEHKRIEHVVQLDDEADDDDHSSVSSDCVAPTTTAPSAFITDTEPHTTASEYVDRHSSRYAASQLSAQDKDCAADMLKATSDVSAIATALSRPLADVLAWYYREYDGQHDIEAGWQPTRRCKRRHDDNPCAPPSLNDTLSWSAIDAANPELPEVWFTEKVASHCNNKPGAGTPRVSRPENLATIIPGPAGSAQLQAITEKRPFAFDGRQWIASSNVEDAARHYRLDTTQLELVQTLVRPTASLNRIIVLPMLPIEQPPAPPSVLELEKLGLFGGELLVVDTNTTAPTRLWYYPRASESFAELGMNLSSIELNRATDELSTAVPFGTDAHSAPQANIASSKTCTRDAALEMLWLEQLQFCTYTDALPQRLSQHDAVQTMLPWRLSGLILLPDCAPFPRLCCTHQKQTPPRDEDDTLILADRIRVLCIVPPSSRGYASSPSPDVTNPSPQRTWTERAAAQDVLSRVYRNRSGDFSSIWALAMSLDCDPESLARRNPTMMSPLLLLPHQDLLPPCTACRCQGEIRKFGCRILRRHVQPPYNLPRPNLPMMRVRRRQDNSVYWFFATTQREGQVVYEFPSCCRPMPPRQTDVITPDGETHDICIVHEAPDFNDIAARCKAIINHTFQFRDSSAKDSWVVTDAFYSLEEGVDTIVCEYTSVKQAAARPLTSTLAHIQASADWQKRPKKVSISDEDDR